MKTMNILFLGGAKRVGMARLLVESGRERDIDVRIFGYELCRECALAVVASDIVEGRRWSDPSIYAHIDSVVAEYSIEIIVPFVDGAVGVAAEYAARYPRRNVFVPAPPRELAEKMFDKIASAAIFDAAGLPIPATYRPGEPWSHLIAKPRYGSASKGIEKIDSEEDIRRIASCNDEYLIQERIDNRREITVDCYASVRNGDILCVSPRLRLETSGGEVVRTVTVDCPDAADIARRAIETIGLRGAVTVQVIHDIDTDRYMIMEINPRLGGGAVASVYAGAGITGCILDEALGRPLSTTKPTPNVLTVRYLQDVFFQNYES